MDKIVAISQESTIPLVQAGIDPQKIAVILNCVDLSAFQPTSVKANSDEYVVGIVGRIEPFKRQKAFVEIAGEGRCANRQSPVSTSSAQHSDTPAHRAYNREVHQLVAKYQLHETVHFTGHCTDMPKAMRELDLLVTLSAGSVIAEAMAAGKPVIGTPIGSTTEMIVHNVTGIHHAIRIYRGYCKQDYRTR